MKRMRGIDLFSGIGGLSLAFDSFMDTVLFCEMNKDCQSILKTHYPGVPIHNDVTTLCDVMDGMNLGNIDIVFGGFPCQDISCSGTGRGIENGARSGLFYRLADVVAKVSPTFVFLENVHAIRTRGLDLVLTRLTQMGYCCRWGTLTADKVGAPHFRRRWFLLAFKFKINDRDFVGTSHDSTIPSSSSFIWKRRCDCARHTQTCGECNEPAIYNEVKNDRSVSAMCAAFGNAVVPKQCYVAFKHLLSNGANDVYNNIQLENNGSLMTHLKECIMKTEECLSGDWHVLTILASKSKLPFFGQAKQSEDGSVRVRINKPWDGSKSALKFPYPTPTRVSRSCAGNVRCACRLVVAEKITWCEGAVIANKDPFEPHGGFEGYHGKDTARLRHPSFMKKHSPPNTYKNVRWLQWLMGFPSDWVNSFIDNNKN